MQKLNSDIYKSNHLREGCFLIGLAFDLYLVKGEVTFPLVGDLIGEDSLTSLPTKVFWTATFSLNFFKGSFLSILSSSYGV
jgi:hypothetical protein